MKWENRRHMIPPTIPEAVASLQDHLDLVTEPELMQAFQQMVHLRSLKEGESHQHRHSYLGTYENLLVVAAYFVRAAGDHLGYVQERAEMMNEIGIGQAKRGDRSSSPSQGAPRSRGFGFGGSKRKSMEPVTTRYDLLLPRFGTLPGIIPLESGINEKYMIHGMEFRKVPGIVSQGRDDSDGIFGPGKYGTDDPDKMNQYLEGHRHYMLVPRRARAHQPEKKFETFYATVNRVMLGRAMNVDRDTRADKYFYSTTRKGVHLVPVIANQPGILNKSGSRVFYQTVDGKSKYHSMAFIPRADRPYDKLTLGGLKNDEYIVPPRSQRSKVEFILVMVRYIRGNSTPGIEFTSGSFLAEDIRR